MSRARDRASSASAADTELLVLAPRCRGRRVVVRVLLRLVVRRVRHQVAGILRVVAVVVVAAGVVVGGVVRLVRQYGDD